MNNPNVFTIPPSLSFVDALADGILDRVGHAPEDLAMVQVLLPTRRACRSLREAFLRRSGGTPMLLPVMVPMGDVDEDELALENHEGVNGLDLAPAIGGMKRTVQLARFVMAMDATTTPDQAVRLAGELSNLVDQVHTEGLDLSTLPNLVKDRELSKYWEKTVSFLSIVGDTWPQVLDDLGALDPAKRRDQLIRKRAQAWADQPPLGMVIAAGSTGTIPATAELLNVIANLEKGALVLPGLDTLTSNSVWAQLSVTHPQYGMAKLLEKIEVSRDQVPTWTQVTPATQVTQATQTTQSMEPTHRQAIIAQALVPAEATHCWRDDPFDPDFIQDALSGITRIDCPGPREEAATVALILREALNTPEQTASFITPDRTLARRVTAELARWNINVDDSAGQPLDQTSPGAFFHLLAEMAAGGFDPISILACLKHPLAAGGGPAYKLRPDVRALEIACLRGPRPAPNLHGLDERHRVFKLDPDGRTEKQMLKLGLDPNGARRILALLRDTVQPFADALNRGEIDGSELLALHTSAAIALSQTDEGPDERRLWDKEAGEALSNFIAEAHEALSDLGPMKPEHYPALIKTLMAGHAVRPLYANHPRVFIWGLLEARLQRTDITVLGGLNEGSWPPQTEASPWMSRPMMTAFGLPLPERRIGLSAHDFAQAICAPRVTLTRSKRNGGSPQVPSRWLVRMDTMLGKHTTVPDEKWLKWAQALTQPDDGIATPCPAPKPAPPIDKRPRQLSVTAIEKWIRDPYAIYAQRILRLSPLDDIDADASAADKGMVIHTVLERFVKAHQDALPPDPKAALIAIGKIVFTENIASPGVRAFWWPRFERIAEWFAGYETMRRTKGFKPALVEESGKITLDGLAGDFVLTATADRMDVDMSGGVTIIDYKTGQAPTTKQVASGLTPQLPLEGLIVNRGGFKSIAKEHPIATLVYLRLTGGRIAGEEKPIHIDGDEAVQNALEGLTKLIHKFDDINTPYLSRPRPMFESRFGNYDHLARVKEWFGEGEAS